MPRALAVGVPGPGHGDRERVDQHRALRRLQDAGPRHLRAAPGGRPAYRVGADQVIVQADHSHSGPDTIGIWGSVPTSYLALLQDGGGRRGGAGVAGARAGPAFRREADGPGITVHYQRPQRGHRRRVPAAVGGGRGDGGGSPPGRTTRRTPPCSSSATSSRRATGRSGRPRWPRRSSAAPGPGRWERSGARTSAPGRRGRGAGRLETADRRGHSGRCRGARSAAWPRGSPSSREPIAQPVLFALNAPEGTVEAGGYDISIDRDMPPW